MRREQWVKFDQWDSFYEISDDLTTGLWVRRTCPVAFHTKTMQGKWINMYLYRHVEDEELNHIRLAVVRYQFDLARGQTHEAR